MDLHFDRRVLEDVTAFAAAFGIQIYDWQREAFGTVCRRKGGRFVYRLAGVSFPRGNGKSFGAAVVGLWRLLSGPPPQDVLGCALEGASSGGGALRVP